MQVSLMEYRGLHFQEDPDSIDIVCWQVGRRGIVKITSFKVNVCWNLPNLETLTMAISQIVQTYTSKQNSGTPALLWPILSQVTTHPNTFVEEEGV